MPVAVGSAHVCAELEDVPDTLRCCGWAVSLDWDDGDDEEPTRPLHLQRLLHDEVGL